MSSKIGDAFQSVASIAKGMTITFGEMMNPTITELYPDSPPNFQEPYRLAHVLQRDENGLEQYVACLLFATACAADCNCIRPVTYFRNKLIDHRRNCCQSHYTHLT